MLPKRNYRLFLGIFPLIYAIHNLEEWFVFTSNIGTFVKFGPRFISQIIAKDPVGVSSIFGIALISATIIPLIVAGLIWNNLNVFRIKILIIIAMVTLINVLSHILSSCVLGFILPGFITSILLLIPYSILLLYNIRRYNSLSLKTYTILGIVSFAVYAIGLGLSWMIGILTVSTLH